MKTWTFLICTIAVICDCSSFAGGSQPLKGDANDGDGNLEWVSETQQQSPRWQVSNWVKNRAPGGHLFVDWKRDVYQGWVPGPPTPENRRGSNSDGGDVEPVPSDAAILYGTSGKKAASVYRAVGKTTDKEQRLACEVRITVRLKEVMRDVFLTLLSTVTKQPDESFQFQYRIVLEQKELAPALTLGWSAAKSPAFDELIMKTHGDARMHFDKETAVAAYTLPQQRNVFVGIGSLIIMDADGKRLGAVYAPAYTSDIAARPGLVPKK